MDEQIEGYIKLHAEYESAPRRVCPKCQFEITDHRLAPEHKCGHNHMTRDIKPQGVCPACDRHHDLRNK